jgi:hypothetical protein
MRTAATIALLTAGAILTFAVSARVPGVDLRLAGVFIMAAGIAALLAPPAPAADWLRRRLGHAGAAAPAPAPAALDDLAQEAYPAYLLQDPAVLAAEVLNGMRSDSWPEPTLPAPSPRAPRTPRAAARPSGPRPLRSVGPDPDPEDYRLEHGPDQRWAGPDLEAGRGRRNEFG